MVRAVFPFNVIPWVLMGRRSYCTNRFSSFRISHIFREGNFGEDKAAKLATTLGEGQNVNFVSRTGRLNIVKKHLLESILDIIELSKVWGSPHWPPFLYIFFSPFSTSFNEIVP